MNLYSLKLRTAHLDNTHLEGGKENILAAAPGVAYDPILNKNDMGM